ncbi:MAG: hypothetical protein ACK5LV_01040 [Lachnospirales bacterium]
MDSKKNDISIILNTFIKMVDEASNSKENLNNSENLRGDNYVNELK